MKNLLKISILISVIGILILLLLSNIIEPKQYKISEINSLKEFEKVKIKGKIISQKNYQNLKIITLSDTTGKIDVLLNKDINFTKNTTIIVYGTIKEYKNYFEIQADKIIY